MKYKENAQVNHIILVPSEILAIFEFFWSAVLYSHSPIGHRAGNDRINSVLE